MVSSEAALEQPTALTSRIIFVMAVLPRTESFRFTKSYDDVVPDTEAQTQQRKCYGRKFEQKVQKLRGGSSRKFGLGDNLNQAEG